jgi:hypothetical protein
MHHSRRFPSSRSQTAQFLRSRGAFLRPGFSSRSGRPRTEGSAERREAPALVLVALVRRDPRLRGMGPPGQPGGRLSALHRGAVAQEPLPSPALPAGSGAKAPRNLASLPAAAPGFRVRGYEPRSTPLPAPPSGSSPETPLMSEDESVCSIDAFCSRPLFVAKYSGLTGLLLLEPGPHDAKLYAPPRVSAAL